MAKTTDHHNGKLPSADAETSDSKPAGLSRRSFLANLGLASVAAAAGSPLQAQSLSLKTDVQQQLTSIPNAVSVSFTRQ